MNETAKLLFDECVGKHISDSFGSFLREVSQSPHEVRHISEFQKLGTADEIWVPQMASLGFMVITGDRSKDPKKKKLKLLCLRSEMTLIMLGHSVHQLKSEPKIRAIMTVWEKILQISAAPRGSRFMMSMSTGPVPIIRPIEIDPEERARANAYGFDGTHFELTSE